MKRTITTATSLVVNEAPDPDAPVESLAPYRDCTVPDFDGEKFQDALDLWRNARFTGSVLDSPSMNGNTRIGWQSLPAGSLLADCVRDITVSRNPPAPAPTPTPTPGPGATPTYTHTWTGRDAHADTWARSVHGAHTHR